MRYWIALFLSLPLAALELSLQSGKEAGESYSILHLRHSSSFTCTATKNEFDEETAIECRFPPGEKRPFAPINNTRLLVKSTGTAQGYTIAITPKSKMKLIPVPFDLTKESQTYQSDVKQARHWTVIGYAHDFPLIHPRKAAPGAINFPVKIDKNLHPYVGGLDLKGNPIKITRVHDVTDYMEMKKAYAAKHYEKVLELADYALKNYPNSVFKNEVMLYKIRSLHEQDEPEHLLETSKSFLREYSSDPNVAEVLAYTANAYGRIGQTIDADYFFDRLFDEQAGSKFASLGMIYKAHQLELSGNPKKAMQFYQKALATSSDLDIASRAAFRLAKMEIESGKTKNAKQYIEKIASANPSYFKDVYDDAMEMAQTFMDRNDPRSASRITESLLKSSESKSSNHELLLRNLGIQLAHSGRRDEALKRLNEYLETYKFGQYVDEIRRAKDGLFFVEGETNATSELKKYDDLIERYGNDSVGRKALYKKAQLLFKEKKYSAVLNMESQLYRLESAEFPQTTAMITQSAIGLEKQHLKEGKCSEALALQKMYKIKLLPEWDAPLFECALKSARYDTAKTIAKRHLKAQSISERQIWLSRMVKTQFSLGEYKEAIKGGEELITLLGAEKNPPLNDIYRTMFDAAQRSGDAEGMIRHIQSVEGAFGSDFKDVERYTQMVSLGLKRKDETIVQNYARKVMALQARTKTSTQTPFIEFTLVQSYQNLGKDAEALEVLKTLEGKKLSAEKRSRQHYLTGAVSLKLGRTAQARAAFNASIKADPASAWGKLAKDALGLL